MIDDGLNHDQCMRSRSECNLGIRSEKSRDISFLVYIVQILEVNGQSKDTAGDNNPITLISNHTYRRVVVRQ